MKDSTKVNLYTGGWCLYFLQGTLGMKGSSVSAILSVVLVTISLSYVFLSQPINEIKRGKIPFLLVALDMFLVVLIFYKVLYMAREGDVTALMSKDLQVLCITLLPVYFYYYYAKKGSLTEREMRYVAVLFFIFMFFYYFQSYEDIIKKVEGDEFTNNAGRFLVTILPMLMLFDDKNRLQIIIGLLVSVLVLLSVKREAILVLTIEIVIVFIWKTRDSSIKQKIKTYFVLLVTVSLIAMLFYYMFENVNYFQKRVSETMYGNLSGRDRIIPKLVYDYFNDTNDTQFLIGRGTLKTLTLVGNFAHNDLVELFTCYGIVGVAFYLNLWVALISFWKKQQSGVLKIASLMLLVDFFCGAFFSRFYFSTYVPLFAMLGFILGRQKNQERRLACE